MHGVSPATQQVSALEKGVKDLEDVYREIDQFANQGTDPPKWPNLLMQFRSAIGQIKQVQETWTATSNGST